MPLPKWIARVNRRTFNKMEMKRGVRPVLTHVGRSSGTIYHTPLDAHPVDHGYIFICMYGSDSDWVKNVLGAGGGSLRIGGDTVELIAPRVVTKDAAWRELPETTKAPPDYLNVTEYLQMDVAT